MIIYKPTTYKVELQREEIETIQNCRSVINNILDALRKRNCGEVSTICDVTMTCSKLEEISDYLDDLTEIESMY